MVKGSLLVIQVQGQVAGIGKSSQRPTHTRDPVCGSRVPWWPIQTRDPEFLVPVRQESFVNGHPCRAVRFLRYDHGGRPVKRAFPSSL